jgi:hypothetical protein
MTLTGVEGDGNELSYSFVRLDVVLPEVDLGPPSLFLDDVHGTFMQTGFLYIL